MFLLALAVVGTFSGRVVARFDWEPLADLAFFGTVAGTLLGVLAWDFLYYWLHRAQHAAPILWRLHAVHHSVTQLGAANSFHHVL